MRNCCLFCLCMWLIRFKIFTCASMRMDPHIYASSAWIRNRMAIPNQQQFILIHNSGAKPGQALWNQFEKIRKIAVKAVNKGSLQNQFSVKVYKKKLQFFLRMMASLTTMHKKSFISMDFINNMPLCNLKIT